MGNQAFNGQRW